MIEKKTTAQVAKALGLTKNDVQQILYRAPTLRPVERVDKLKRYLWSEAEIEAVRLYLTLHPRRARTKRLQHNSARDTPCRLASYENL